MTDFRRPLDCNYIIVVGSQSVLHNPLPPQLAKDGEVTREEHFITTTGTAHDQKHFGLSYGNLDPLYKKAPASWKVHYNKDLHEKVCDISIVNITACFNNDQD